MLSTVGITAIIGFCLLASVFGANKNDACNNVNDCSDAGTTCSRGRCQCWSDMGFNVAMTWACNEDRSCEVLFPGHVCRPTRQCNNFSGRMGYCQPVGSLGK